MDKIDRLNKQNQQIDTVLMSRILKKCPKCRGRMYKDYYENKCESCDYSEPTDEQKIKKALEADSSLTARDLARITKIPRDAIDAYLKDGFLCTTDKSHVYCQICNTKLISGTTCPKCTNLFKDDIKSAKEGKVFGGDKKNDDTTKSPSGPKMHFIGRR